MTAKKDTPRKQTVTTEGQTKVGRGDTNPQAGAKAVSSPGKQPPGTRKR